jgi:hypothetical protein
MISVAQGSGQGLLQLGATEVTALLPSAWGWWRPLCDRALRRTRGRRNDRAATGPGHPADAGT